MKILAILRQLADQGYETRQIGLSMIAPHMGKKVSAQKTKLNAAEKAKQKLRSVFLRRKAAQAKAKAKGKAEEQAELEAVAEPQELGPPNNPS